MAGRPMRRLHQEDVRAKIKTSQLINRLSDHGFGKVDLKPTQVDAIKALLKKTLPDLTSVQLSGPDDADGNPQPFIEVRLIAPEKA